MSFRSLHEQLLDYSGQHVMADVLSPWVLNNPVDVEWFSSHRTKIGPAIPKMSLEERWSLYAASLVFEVLVLGFQKGEADGDWRGPPISKDELIRFSRLIGLEVIRSDKYSPFHHEIVELVSSSQPTDKPRVIEYYWPCLMLGPLLFMRAGAAISVGSSVMRPGIANASTLYWAQRRRYRPHQDLSHGWGYNSSYRTSFRRDYHLNNTFHFNVDGETDLLELDKASLNDEGLSLDERMELVANRCFITVTKDGSEQWPYDDRFSMKSE